MERTVKGKCQPERMPALASKGMNRLVKDVWVPTAKELEGQGLMVHFEREMMEVQCSQSIARCVIGK